MDGVGEWATTSYGIGNKNEMEVLADIKFPHSLGLLYSAISFYCLLWGRKGLKMDCETLIKHFHRGDTNHQKVQLQQLLPHMIIPIKGRFKGEYGERCHLIPLAESKRSKNKYL